MTQEYPQEQRQPVPGSYLSVALSIATLFSAYLFATQSKQPIFILLAPSSAYPALAIAKAGSKKSTLSILDESIDKVDTLPVQSQHTGEKK